MQVTRPDTRFEQVVGEISDIFLVVVIERALALSSRRRISLSRSSIWLRVGAQLDLGVDDSGRRDQLPGDARRVAQLPVARGGRDHDELGHLARNSSKRSGRLSSADGGSRSRQASACASGRPRTSPDLRHRPGATRRRRRRSRRGSSRAAYAAVSRAACRPGCASSSRSRCRSQAPASSRGRTRCAGGCGAPRASALPPRTSSPAPRARRGARRPRARPSASR